MYTYLLLLSNAAIFNAAILQPKKEQFIKNSDIFIFFSQNINLGICLNRLGKVVLMSAHNLCF